MPGRNFFAAYGLLRRRSLARRGHAVLQNLRYCGTGLLRGIAFLQHGYPGVVEQPGIVLVEIFEVLDNSVWEILDRFEGYDASRRRHLLFYRKQVQLLRPQILVSAYFLGREIPRGRKCNAELCFTPLIDQPGRRTQRNAFHYTALHRRATSPYTQFWLLKDFYIQP
ncbi:MAG TPA: gamma-glutamylcyclotransferase [Chthoniobacterales bacterium]|nr:gamma-glutamylcyclotransferase [Chthoniobacterales bacterium]